MLAIRSLAFTLAAAIASVAGAQTAITTWNFNTPGGLEPSNGPDGSPGPGELQFYDGPGGVVSQNVTFGTTTSFGIADIGGQPANVIFCAAAGFGGPSDSGANGFKVLTGAQPNGGGFYINEYTVIQDVLFPSSVFVPGNYFTFYNTNEANNNDGDLFADFSNGSIGISGSYQGAMTADTWHRVAFVFKASTPGGSSFDLRKYIDGELVGVQSGLSARDGRFSLYSVLDAGTEWYLGFADNNGETTDFYLNSYQFSDKALTDGQIASLGGPTADGITIPGDPPEAFDLTSPANNAANVAIAADFSWTASVNATSYLLEIDTEPFFAEPRSYEATVTGTTASVAAGVLRPGTNYFWRVTAQNEVGGVVSTSPFFVFTTNTPCPADFNGDGAINSDDLSDYITAYFNDNSNCR